MAFSRKILVATAALGLAMAVSTAMAQDDSMAPTPAGSSTEHMDQGKMQDMTPTASSSRMDSMQQGMMDKSMHDKNGSMHMMPATVTSVDAKSGKVGVDAGGMALTVHFPPRSMASLKAGDKITLHLGYTQ